jgi:hypothetical protein
MKTLAVSLIICFALSATAAFSPLRRYSCHCSSDDGTCSTTVSCRNGCVAFCPSDGCVTSCISEGQRRRARPTRTGTFPPKSSDGDKDDAEIALLTPVNVALNPMWRQDIFNAEMQTRPRSKTGNDLSAERSMRKAEQEDDDNKTLRRALLGGKRMGICIRNVSAVALADKLSSITGLDVHAEPEDASVIINYSAKASTLQEALSQVSARYHLQFSIR